MLKYTLGRLLNLIPILFGVTFLVFASMHLLPGDPVEEMMAEWGATAEDRDRLRAQLGLDDPFLVQYTRFLAGAVRGDFGNSIERRGTPVMAEIRSQLPATFRLTLASLVIAVVFGLSLGTISALAHGKWIDTAATTIAVAGVSMPNFWLGLLLLYVFSLNLGWFPYGGSQGGWRTLILPAVTLGTHSVGVLARVTRSSLLEVMANDYIKTARAKGVAEAGVVFKHGMRNALIPVVTLAGLQVGFLLGGSVVVETIFSRQGLGHLTVQAVIIGDFPVVQGAVTVAATAFLLVNLFVDLTYGLLDPQIRYD